MGMALPELPSVSYSAVAEWISLAEDLLKAVWL